MFTLIIKRTFHKYLSPHLQNILSANPSKLQQLTPYFQRLLSHPQNSIPSRINMLYHLHTLPTPLHPYQHQLADRIINQSINTQQQLDRIIAAIKNNLKHNKNIKLQQLLSKQYDLQPFHQQLAYLAKQPLTISQVSKRLREKYLHLDSNYIYQETKNVIQSQVKKNNHFWDKINNIKPRLIEEECNDPNIYQQHLKIINNQPRFRFPPQPNGYLHIGHIKSIRINFQTAIQLNGLCYLRFDDTNPDTESEEYIRSIEENVKWLGYTPHQITFASDYFEPMIHYANQLIKKGYAYVCETSQSQIENQRKNKLSNPYRQRPIHQSLSIFPNLSPNQTLRLKGHPSANNPNLRDPIIYRVKNTQHPKTGTKFKIYPIYDYAHCLSDSIEHIDYSLCSLEFEVRRQLYYKYLHLLNLYKPNVWEYSRVNIENNLLSKRKIKSLIERDKVDGWKDPRLMTIDGLKARGYTPSMLISFIDKVNSSRSGNENIIKFNVLERQMKKQLFEKSKKSMAISNPILIQIINLIHNRKLQIPSFQNSQLKRNILLSKYVYIQRKQDLNKGDEFILKYVGIFRVITKNQQQLIVEQTFSFLNSKPIKSNDTFKNIVKKLHWLSIDEAVNIPFVYYDRLLNDDQSFNEKSKISLKDSLVHKALLADTHQYWHLERVGYFKWNQDRKIMIRCCQL